MTPAVTALLCRTSDYGRHTLEGADALALALGERWRVESSRLGEVEEGRRARWQDDLRDSAACLSEAGRRVGEDLDRGRLPVLCSGHCPPCMTTLPEVVRRHPECHVLWIDAHPDFNSPQTTASQFLGGMCLAAACGVWESGFGGGVPPSQVIVTDGRDIDPGERDLLVDHGVRVLPPAPALDAVAGREVFVHLDLDVLDPEFLPGLEFPVPDGLDLAALESLLAGVAARTRLVGIEITDCPSPEPAPALAGVVARGLAGVLAGTVP
jgi:arginase family enzyme